MPMNLPDLYEESSSKVKTEVFAGLNRAPRIGDGEFHDMQNLSSDEYPVLSVRARRERKDIVYNNIKHYSGPRCLFASSPSNSGKLEVCFLDRYVETGDDVKYGLVMNGRMIRLGLDSADGRSVVRMGAYAIVVPDMVYVNTVDLSDYGPISDRFVIDTSEFCVRLNVTDSDGKTADYRSKSEPNEEDIENGALWHKIVNDSDRIEPELYRYNKEEDAWKREGSFIRVEIQTNGIASGVSLKSPLAEGQIIRMEGVSGTVNGVDFSLDGDHVVRGVTRNSANPNRIMSFMVQGAINDSGTRVQASAENPISFERPIPKLDFACEADNRIWGCRYENGTTDINEIYCCARGDFYRWIQGATDDPDAPVTFSIGADGAWTGAICYQGYPTFFKENVIYRLSGTGTSGYGINETRCMGVGNGFDKSLAVVGNILYYKSAGPVMAFDGSVPVPVSDKLGRLTGYTHAAGGACGEKYYLCLWKDGNAPDAVLYVLDAARGLWHKEDDACVESMVSIGEHLYMSVKNTEQFYGGALVGNYTPDNVIYMVGGDEGRYMEGPVRWYAETGVIGMESDTAKYLSKIMVRLSMDVGSTVRISVQYDSMGTFKQLMAVEADRMKVVTLPILPVRCDHLRLRLEGVGGCRLFSLTKVFETSEDL